MSVKHPHALFKLLTIFTFVTLFSIAGYSMTQARAAEGPSTPSRHTGFHVPMNIPVTQPLTDTFIYLPFISSNNTTSDPTPGPVSCSDAQFEDDEGLVIIETEAVTPTTSSEGAWVEETAVADYTGTGYYQWTGTDLLDTPGEGVLTYKIKINSAGTYTFEWRGYNIPSTSNSENNSVWVRFPDVPAEDFYAENRADRSQDSYPIGNTENLTPTLDGSADGWFNTLTTQRNQWSWRTRTGNNDHDIKVAFDTPGVYTMEISARSTEFALDRIILYNNSASNGRQDTSNEQTDCTDPTGPPQFEEQNGLVVMEIESVTPETSAEGAWVEKPGNGSSSSYYEWDGNDLFGQPNEGTMTFKMQINTPGKYRFLWRSQNIPAIATEHNDAWARFPNVPAGNWYGEKGTSIVYPRGSGLTPNPEGASANNWLKVYLSRPDGWHWRAATNDNDGHDVFVEFDDPGLYILEISGRSDGFALDRVVLFNDTVSEADATDLSQPETLYTE